MADRFIRKLEYGSALTEDDRRLVRAATRDTKRIGARRGIIREGQPPFDAHIVMEGVACRYKDLDDGRRQIMALFLPGDLCDFHVHILGKMDHGIGTITECTVASLPPKTIGELTANPRINRGLWWMTLVDEGTLREWLVNLGRRPAAQRLAHLFCEMLVRLQAVGLAGADRFDLSLSQGDLSEALGLTPVHVNRTMQQLRRDGYIRTEDRTLVIPDVAELQQFAGFDPNYLHLHDRDQAAHAHHHHHAATALPSGTATP